MFFQKDFRKKAIENQRFFFPDKFSEQISPTPCWVLFFIRNTYKVNIILKQTDEKHISVLWSQFW